MSIRTRTLDYSLEYPPTFFTPSSGTEGEYRPASSEKFPGGQITESSGHPWPPLKGSFGDIGGNFASHKIEWKASPSTVKCETQSNGRHELKYSGPSLIAVVDAPHSVLQLPTGSSSLDRQGAEAISKTAPTNPEASVSTGILETLTEGLPSIPLINTWKKRLSIIRAAGDEFLNYEFGWAPLKREIEETARAISDSSKNLKQFERDHNSDTRRRYHFPPEESRNEKVYPEQNVVSGNLNSFVDRSFPATMTLEETHERYVWFSGAFSYPMPSGSSLDGLNAAGEKANHLLGTSLTPDVAWELAPWSWAVDWFSDAGDVVNNFTNIYQYGLVIRYGYIMEEVKSRYTWTADHSGLVDPNPPPGPMSLEITSKYRRRANPFGFGIGWEDLSPTQLAITASLGITRVL